MLINEKYLIGYIKNTHNLNGELIFSIKDFFIKQFINTEQVFVDINNLPVPFFIDKIKPHNNQFIVKLNDVNTIDEASELIGCEISIDKTKLKSQNKDEINNLNELINYKVIDQENNLIGYVNNFIDFDKNNLLIVKDENNKEILIPINPNFIKEIKSDTIIVYLPDGLIDIN